MSTLAAITRRLTGAPTTSVHEVLVRRVPLLSLIKYSPPNFLYTSGRPGRYNPAGLECVYFGEEEETLKLEYERGLAGTKAAKQPFATYFARISLMRALDLTDDATLKALKLAKADLHKSWRRGQPTETQKLGLVVSTSSSISAIRYPSDAASAAGKTGTNIVIYRNRVAAPDYVKILGEDRKPLQTWP